jgi:alanine-synthesizing transaminase
VIVNPNNPTGAVYPRAVLEQIVRLAEERGLVLLCDEIYDQITYDEAEFVPVATLVQDTVCVTMSGLSKVYRACGYRVGWAVVSGKLRAAEEFIAALELLASLRLCSNVPGQWAVQTALGGHQSILELTRPGGRLYESRRVIIDSAAANPSFKVSSPQGALYAFVGVRDVPGFDDQAFALDLLEQKHVLVAPGVSFNVPYTDHFRITNLPDADTLRVVFSRMGELLESYRNGTQKLPSAETSVAVSTPSARAAVTSRGASRSVTA